MRPLTFIRLLVLPAGIVAAGCGSPQMPPVSQAPPISANMPSGYNAPPMQANAQMQPQGSAGVYQWQDVPLNQQVPISRAVFDQGGYQIFAQSGETIVVPFANQNLYVLKFGQTNGNPYFVNEGSAPVLYLSPGGFLENAAAQGARWYPFSQNYAYTQPVYVGLAPSWNDYVGMGWYPGMHYYGGMWGMTPYSHLWMPGFYINIGGNRYTDYGRYRSYYTTHTNYAPMRTVYSNYGTRSTGSFGTGRVSSGFGNRAGSTGSFGTGRTSSGFGNGAGSTGSFGSGRSSGFGGANGSGGSFGAGRSRTTFGSPGASGSGSFGSGTRASGGSSFGGASGYSNTPRASGGSFGGGRSSSGGSFGGGRSSGGSFGGGRSSGSSFGGGRRR